MNLSPTIFHPYQTKFPSTTSDLAYDNPLEWQSSIHNDRGRLVPSNSAAERFDAPAEPLPEPNPIDVGAGHGAADLSINSKPGLPDWLAKISK